MRVHFRKRSIDYAAFIRYLQLRKRVRMLASLVISSIQKKWMDYTYFDYVENICSIIFNSEKVRQYTEERRCTGSESFIPAGIPSLPPTGLVRLAA